MDHPAAEARPSILIVEPDPGSRAALQTVLRPFADLHTAASAAEALQTLAAHRDIHLATVEVRLPDGSGLDLLHEVRRGHPEVDTIIVTGFGGLASAVEGLKAGAVGYFLKPFNVSELVNVVLQTLKNRRELVGAS
jgi:DNA-binding NtrC family response regulator